MQKNGKVHTRHAMRHGETNMRLWYKARIWQSKTLQIWRWITQSPSSPKRMGHLTAIQSVLSKWPSITIVASKSHELVKKFKNCLFLNHVFLGSQRFLKFKRSSDNSVNWAYLFGPLATRGQLQAECAKITYFWETIKQFRFTYLPHKAVGGRWKNRDL